MPTFINHDGFVTTNELCFSLLGCTKNVTFGFFELCFRCHVLSKDEGVPRGGDRSRVSSSLRLFQRGKTCLTTNSIKDKLHLVRKSGSIKKFFTEMP